MDNSSIVTVSPNIIAEAAPRFLACLLNWGLYGSLSVQVYWYYVAFPKDAWFPQIIVYSVYALDTAQTIIVTDDVFNAYAKHFGNEKILDSVGMEWLAVPVLTSIISCIVQMYYGYRIKILSHSWMLTLAICLVSITQAVAGIMDGASAIPHGVQFSHLERISQICNPMWLSGNVLCDTIITISMVYWLLRKDTHIPETRTLVSKLVRIVIESGTLTASAALLSLILYVAIPHREYSTAVTTILGKLYFNSLLAIFNSRSKFAENHSWKTNPLYLSFQPNKSINDAKRTLPVFLNSLRKNSNPERSTGGVEVRQEISVSSDQPKCHANVEGEETKQYSALV